MPHYEVRAKPPDNNLDRICSVGVADGEADQRLSHSPQVPGGKGEGDRGP